MEETKREEELYVRISAARMYFFSPKTQNDQFSLLMVISILQTKSGCHYLAIFQILPTIYLERHLQIYREHLSNESSVIDCYTIPIQNFHNPKFPEFSQSVNYLQTPIHLHTRDYYTNTGYLQKFKFHEKRHIWEKFMELHHSDRFGTTLIISMCF